MPNVHIVLSFRAVFFTIVSLQMTSVITFNSLERTNSVPKELFDKKASYLLKNNHAIPFLHKNLVRDSCTHLCDGWIAKTGSNIPKSD